MSTRILVLGKGEMAIRAGEFILRHRYDSPYYDFHCAVPVVPEPDWAPSFASWCGSCGIHTVQSGDWRLVVGVYDLALSIFYDRRIGKDLIDRCGRFVNLHNGLLPQYRGCRPINWALKNGDAMAGVTLHEVTPRFDDGPIVAQVAFSLYPDDEVASVYQRACEFGFTLLTETLPSLDTIEGVPQDESKARYYTMKDAERLGDRAEWRRHVRSTPPAAGHTLNKPRRRIAATAAENGASTKGASR